MDPPENGPGRRNVKVGQIIIQGDGVEFALDLGMREQSLDLGREEEASADLGVIQGLEAEAIAGEKQATVLRVPEREGEHPHQLGE